MRGTNIQLTALRIDLGIEVSKRWERDVFQTKCLIVPEESFVVCETFGVNVKFITLGDDDNEFVPGFLYSRHPVCNVFDSSSKSDPETILMMIHIRVDLPFVGCTSALTDTRSSGIGNTCGVTLAV